MQIQGLTNLSRQYDVQALVGALNQEKALVGAFSVIVKTHGSLTALVVGGDTDTDTRVVV